MKNTIDNIIDTAQALRAVGCPCSIHYGEHSGVLLTADAALWLASIIGIMDESRLFQLHRLYHIPLARLQELINEMPKL